MRSGFLNNKEQAEFMTRRYKDCIVQTRVSSMTLANAIIWLENTYGKVYNMSQALRGSLEILEKTAISEGLEVITDPEQAELFLNRLGIQLRTSKVGGYSHMRALQQDEIRKEQQPTKLFNDGLPETKEDYRLTLRTAFNAMGKQTSEEELTIKTNFGWTKVCEQRKVQVQTPTQTAPLVQPTSESETESEFNWNDTEKLLEELDKPQVVVEKENEHGK